MVERLGDPFAPRSFSLIAIHKYGIPDVFPEAVLEEADRSAKQSLGAIGEGGREDLRHLPIVAIDPSDARDHDDAIWAAPDEDPKNPGGWQAIVAIADVSYYVRPGDGARHAGQEARQQRLFPRSGRADAARDTFLRRLLAGRGRGSRRARLPSDD